MKESSLWPCSVSNSNAKVNVSQGRTPKLLSACGNQSKTHCDMQETDSPKGTSEETSQHAWGHSVAHYYAALEEEGREAQIE